MNLKNILVHIDNSDACPKRLGVAVGLARSNGAHLVGFHGVRELTVPVYIDTAVPADVLEAQREQLETQIAEAKRLFDDATRELDHGSEWRPVRGRLERNLILHARYADLVVCGQADPDDAKCVSEGLAEEVVIESGCPALVVPYVGPRATVGQRILVAWNETREATRAVRDALPLLVAAEKVDVIVVNPDGRLPLLSADLSQYLSRHGVRAEAHQVVGADIEVGDILLSRAADLGSDMLVMGAYGHSRFRELILGGATRNILAHMTVPTLVSH